MIDRPELHPADLRTRQRLLRQLREARAEENISAVSVAAELNVCKSRFNQLETELCWQVCRVQEWSRCLGRRLRMSITGLAVPDSDGDLTAAVLARTVTFGGADEDQLHLFTVVNDLVRARRYLGLSRKDVADRMLITESAVGGWERDHAGTLVLKVQRYARALSDDERPVWLDLALEPLPATALVGS